MAEPDSATTHTGEPEWYAKALELKSAGLDDEAIADAVEKSPSTVRKLIKRKTEAGEFTPPEAGLSGGSTPEAETGDAGTPQPAGPVSSEQAQQLRDAAGDSAGDPDPQPELFPVGSIDGDGVSLKSLIKPGMTVELTASMMSAEVPLPSGTGLLDPGREGLALVTYEVAKAAEAIPQREGERGQKTLKGYKLRQTLRPVFVERVRGEEGVLEANFAALLEASPSRAGALLDRLLVRAGRKLAD